MEMCSKCGNEVKDSTGYCDQCDVLVDVSLESESFLEKFIGKKYEYYKKSWDTSKNWNWAALLFGIFWVGYRKMYNKLFALIMWQVATLTVHKYFINQNNIPISKSVIAIIFGVIIARNGNIWYKEYLERKLINIDTLNAESKNKLIRQGATNFFIPILLIPPKLSDSSLNRSRTTYSGTLSLQSGIIKSLLWDFRPQKCEELKPRDKKHIGYTASANDRT